LPVSQPAGRLAWCRLPAGRHRPYVVVNHRKWLDRSHPSRPAAAAAAAAATVAKCYDDERASVGACLSLSLSLSVAL